MKLPGALSVSAYELHNSSCIPPPIHFAFVMKRTQTTYRPTVYPSFFILLK